MKYCVLIFMLVCVQANSQDCTCNNYNFQIDALTQENRALRAEMTQMRSYVKLIMEANPTLQLAIDAKLEQDRKEVQAAKDRAAQAAQTAAEQRAYSQSMFIVATVAADGSTITTKSNHVYKVNPVHFNLAKKLDSGSNLDVGFINGDPRRTLTEKVIVFTNASKTISIWVTPPKELEDIIADLAKKELAKTQR